MFSLLYAVLCKLFFFTGAVGEGSYPKPLPPEDMRLVVHIVKKYTGAAETDDMISVGSIGLIKAINTYEPGRGTRLATYTARCVENEILMLIRAGKKHKNTLSLSDPVGTSPTPSAPTRTGTNSPSWTFSMKRRTPSFGAWSSRSCRRNSLRR